MGIGSEIRELREAAGLSQGELAKKMGLKSWQTILRYEKETRQPPVGFMDRLRKALAIDDIATKPRSDSYVYVPLYSVEASAGSGVVVAREDVQEILALGREWIRRELGADPTKLALLFMRGDSMAPTLQPGEMLLMEKAEGRQPGDGICVVRLGEDLLVKRLQRMPGGKIKVVSDNAAYESYPVDPADEAAGFVVVGRVIWAGRRL